MAQSNNLNWLVGLGLGLTAAAQAYSGYQAAQSADKQAQALREQAAATRESALSQVKQLQRDAAQRSKEFQTQIEVSKAQTAQSVQAAQTAQQTALQQIAQQKSASALAIQQSQLQSAIQRQQQGAPVGTRVRRRIGTPAAMRTSLEIQSPLAGGVGTGTPNATGGLNV